MRWTTRLALASRDAGRIGSWGIAAVLAAVAAGCGVSDAPGEARTSSKTEAAPTTGATKPKESPLGSLVSSKPQTKVVSSIAGDRMSVLTTSVTLTKQTEPSPFRFTEVSREWGIDFTHFSGTQHEKHFPTANGSGVAMFDYDRDGLFDLYFASATLLPLGTAEKGPNRLYKNLGDGKFKDVTEGSGLDFRGYCHGIIVGDIDNDGDRDVFLCNYDRNKLYVNNGDGTFKDVSKAAGIDVQRWSSGGAMLDYDNDGFLDIYVAVYGIWNYPEDHVNVGDFEKKIWLYTSPRSVKTTRHMFYHNNGDGTFTDVYDKVIMVEKEKPGETVKREQVDPATGEKKMVEVAAKERVPNPRSDAHGFGVVTADLNDDGLIDIYVANDMTPNFLFLNHGDGTFDDVSEASGAAYDYNGGAQSGMAADAEDVDGKGLPALYVTNFANEYNTLYQNFGNGVFFDNTAFFGMASDTMPFVGWGSGLFDFDKDGWPDVFVSNGHVDDNRHLLGQPVDYEEIPLLFRNIEGKRFRLSTRDVGPYFDQKHVGRGVAFGDLDNDGDVDIVVNEKDRHAAVLRNDTPTDNHWVRLAFQGTRSNRDAVGTLVMIDNGKRIICRQVKGGVSLESANDPRLVVGVGPNPIKKMTIVWPSGIVTEMADVALDREHKIVEPKDQKPSAPYGEARIRKLIPPQTFAAPKAKATEKPAEKSTSSK